MAHTTSDAARRSSPPSASTAPASRSPPPPLGTRGAYYSAPDRLVGQSLWVRAIALQVQLPHEYAHVATDLRARAHCAMLHDHLRPDKVKLLLQSPAWCRLHAAEIGPAGARFIDGRLGERPLDRLRSA